MGLLILKRANTSPLSGQWSDDDYDVLENGVIIGRIFKVPIVPAERAWMWASGHHGEIRSAAHGYKATREAAMAAFAKSCRRHLALKHHQLTSERGILSLSRLIGLNGESQSLERKKSSPTIVTDVT